MTNRIEHTAALSATTASAGRSGFTLVEMLVVSSVIIALMAIGIPVLFRAKANAAVTASTNLIESVAAAVASYGTRSWTWTTDATTSPPTTTTALLSDLDQDGVIDGDPVAEGLSAAICDSGYLGFLDMAQPPVPPEFVNEQRQVVDAWGHSLRISYPQPKAGASQVQVRAELLRYGAAGFKVWSVGPDGTPDTADDIRHGEQQHDD